MNIFVEKRTIHNIPTLSLVPEQTQEAPVIFFIPGYGETKEAGLQLGYKLARQGFYFLSFDPLYHGERYDLRLNHAADLDLGGIYPPEMGIDTLLTMFRVIHHCLQDTRILLDHLASDSRADVSHCGVTGLSMGGYASFTLFANLQQVRVAVPMIGLPHFTRRWLDILDESAFPTRTGLAPWKNFDPRSKPIPALSSRSG